MTDLPIITCILVVHPSGERVWMPEKDYFTDPEPETTYEVPIWEKVNDSDRTQTR